MSADHNLNLVRRFLEEGIAKANLAVFDEVLDPSITVRTGLSPQGPIAGRDAYKAVFSGFAEAFPVRSFELHDLLAAGDRVVGHFTATTVFRKEYYGIAATNQVVAMEEVHLLRLRDGLIVENIVSGTNFPFEYLMYPVLKDMVIGNLPVAD